MGGPAPSAVTRLCDGIDDALAAGLRSLPDWRGKTRLALRWMGVRERRGPLGGSWRMRLWDGSVVCLPRGSRMTWSVAATGHWDRHVIELLTRYIEPETLALDIGASLGLWTVPLGRAARLRRGRLWCFEPNPENVPWLEANIDRNDLRAVAEVHPVALGSHTGNARLGYREHGGGNGALLDVDADDSVTVPLARIDDFDFPQRVSFVKMDVEGFELEVLRGAHALIARDRPTIFGEFNATWMRLRGEDLAAGLATITMLGYEVFELEERRTVGWRSKDQVTLRRLAQPLLSSSENLLLVPAERCDPLRQATTFLGS